MIIQFQTMQTSLPLPHLALPLPLSIPPSLAFALVLHKK
jgi:hypothetical protein